MSLMHSCKADHGTCALVLCAGASRRMGAPKGLLDVGGIALLRAHVEAFATVGLATVVVLGPRLAEHVAALPAGVRVVWNPRWADTDMSGSAFLALKDLGVALVTPVDAPPAREETLRRLLAAPGDAVPTWQGRDGHPVRLAPPHRAGRLDLRLAAAPRIPVDDPACVLNLNTPEAWAAWRAG